MPRVRISTTVDQVRLQRSRELFGASDSQMLDRALSALIEQMEAERERAALERQPYDEDGDLGWEAPDLPALPYEGAIPPEVLELAERRRA